MDCDQIRSSSNARSPILCRCLVFMLDSCMNRINLVKNKGGLEHDHQRGEDPKLHAAKAFQPRQTSSDRTSVGVLPPE